MPRKPRLLVVEDNILLLLDLVDGLADHGIETVPVSSADGALAYLTDHIDGLITDIELPGTLSGLDLARIVSTRRPGLPVVVVSGGLQPAPAQLPPGAVFIPKPYTLDRILTALATQRRHRLAA